MDPIVNGINYTVSYYDVKMSAVMKVYKKTTTDTVMSWCRCDNYHDNAPAFPPFCGNVWLMRCHTLLFEPLLNAYNSDPLWLVNIPEFVAFKRMLPVSRWSFKSFRWFSSYTNTYTNTVVGIVSLLYMWFESDSVLFQVAVMIK